MFALYNCAAHSASLRISNTHFRPPPRLSYGCLWVASSMLGEERDKSRKSGKYDFSFFCFRYHPPFKARRRRHLTSTKRRSERHRDRQVSPRARLVGADFDDFWPSSRSMTAPPKARQCASPMRTSARHLGLTMAAFGLLRQFLAK